MSGQRVKVVEISPVTDEDLEDAINSMVDKGYELERIDYVKEVGVRRPQMAFLFFTHRRKKDEDE